MTKQIKIGKSMYDVLSKGDNATVIALSNTQVAKLFSLGNVCAKQEYHLLQQANKINNLLVKVIEQKYSDDYNYELLIMERLRIEQYRSFSILERKSMLNEFNSSLSQLHDNGFAHGDIKRPNTFINGNLWDNICTTYNGIRLIDVGCSVINTDSLFESKVKQDQTNFEEFANIFLQT